MFLLEELAIIKVFPRFYLTTNTIIQYRLVRLSAALHFHADILQDKPRDQTIFFKTLFFIIQVAFADILDKDQTA